ncbi:MAG TPA: SDR family oxidoreductase [Caulobacteraceae bacterium]|nr:SDR family oxidoreductase [Caulobacteraceae bacterium]
MTTLTGQVALVTGAGRGFGRAIAMRLAREGAAVALMARSAAELEATAAAIAAEGGQAVAIPGDVTSREDVDRAAALAAARLGAVSILISNAGVPGPFGPVWQVDPDQWWRSQALHIRAPVLLFHALVPGMIARAGGRIVLVSAIASHMTAPHLSAYCVGKTAQVRLVQHLAAEGREHGIHAFAIDPGFVITQLAEDTMGSPDAQRWLGGMVERLAERKKTETGGDLERCAQRCLDLVSGRYDGLSGRYMELPDDLDRMLQEAP